MSHHGSQRFTMEGSLKKCSIFSEYSVGKMVIKYLHQTNPTNIGVLIVPDTPQGKLKFLFCEGKDKQTNVIAKKTAGKASKKTEARQSTVI